MTLKQFIIDNRADLNAAINSALYRHDGRGGKGVVPDPAPAHSMADIREWILNDEGLYRWAQSAGVRI